MFGYWNLWLGIYLKFGAWNLFFSVYADWDVMISAAFLSYNTPSGIGPIFSPPRTYPPSRRKTLPVM